MAEKIPENLLKIIDMGETYTTEFKEASMDLPKSLFESICGMLNRNGGYIFLGVRDDKTIIGVDKNAIAKIKKDYVIILKKYFQQYMLVCKNMSIMIKLY